ncbi:MAG TPA: AI-2E family transporter [Actinopolymorphaceae bacterium]
MKASALPRGIFILVGLAAAVVTVVGIQGMSGILGPLFLALMLVITVSPVQRRLTALQVPRWLATVLVLIMLYAILLGLGVVLVVSAARLTTILPSYADQAQELVNAIAAQLARFGVDSSQAGPILQRIDPNQVLNVATGLLAGVAGIFSNLLFLFLLVFFIGLDSAGFPERLRAMRTSRPEVAHALSSFARGTRRYVAVSAAFGVICAVLDAIALAWIGVPLPVLWGLLAFITNFIPNIGFFIGLLPPALLAVLDGGWTQMLLVIIAYCVINFLVQTVIQPKFLGNTVGLTVTMTFLGLTFWTIVLGPLGALLAIPMTLLAKALLVDIDPSSRWMNLLIEARPDLGEHAPPEGGGSGAEHESDGGSAEPEPEATPEPPGDEPVTEAAPGPGGGHDPGEHRSGGSEQP